MLNTTSPVATPPGARRRSASPSNVGAVGQHQQRHVHRTVGRAGSRQRVAPVDRHRASPSITTGSPAQHGVADPAVQLAAGVRRVAARLASAAGSTTHVARRGRSRTRLAGRPASIGPPWRSPTPAMAAGCHDSRASTCSIGRSSSVRASASAVSSPSIPGRRLVERAAPSAAGRGGRGRWRWRRSCRRPARPAPPPTSAAVRSGGFTLNTGS